MPNWCVFEINVVGPKEGVEYMLNVLKCDYSYHLEPPTFSFKEHVFRTYIDGYAFDKEYDQYGDYVHYQIWGDCAWSVYCCMFDDGSPFSYYTSIKNNYPNNRCTTLIDLSARFGLIIEIWSEEPGMCFREHYMIQNGVMIVDECINTVWHMLDGYNNYNEYVQDYTSNAISEEAFNQAIKDNVPYIAVPSDEEVGYLTFSEAATNPKANYLCKVILCKSIE